MSNDVETIKDRLDVAEIVGEYVQLKKAGRSFKGICPFHQEKTPSFIVTPDKGIWHCFGCHKGGDVFSFLQEIEGIDFRAALKMLAERAGVELKGYSKQSSDRRQRLFDLLDLAQRFYQEILLRHSAGEKAKTYLAERGMLEETMRTFGVGYAPHAWGTLQNYLRSKGYSPQEVIAAGLAGQSERGKVYDRFRGRIMFPIRDLQGRVVAFGGRIAPWHATGEEGKYVNSPETELYQKRRIIYNLDQAKHHLRHQEPVIVVEGYMDVAMLAQHGVSGVVAVSGTAFTDEAAKILGRYTQRLHFAFDADAAGFNAALGAGRLALTHGLRVAAVVIPAGKDPADLVNETPEAVEKILSNPKALTTVLLDRLQETQTGEEREVYLKEVLPLVALAKNPVFQGEMIQELATSLHIPEARLMQEMALLPRESMVSSSNDSAVPVDLDESHTTLSSEQYLLGMILAYPQVREQAMASLRVDYFLDKKAQALYNELHGLANGESTFFSLSADAVLEHLAETMTPYAEVLRRLSEERVDRSQEDVLVEVQSVLQYVTQRALERQLEHLQRELADSSDDERLEKLEAFNELTEKISRNASKEVE